MNIEASMEIYGGGPGSGCTGPNCGRPSLMRSKGSGAVIPIARPPDPDKTPVELTMERGGTFKPELKPVPGSVGKCDLPTANVYRYHCEVTASDNSLSAEGFIMDNARIQEFFDNAYNGMNEMSCERMASFAARGIGQILQREHISCVKCTVKIGGSNNAWLTAVWKPKQSVAAAADPARHFDVKDDERARKSIRRIHRGLVRAGFKSLGAGIYVHPDGTKYTISYKGKKGGNGKAR